MQPLNTLNKSEKMPLRGRLATVFYTKSPDDGCFERHYHCVSHVNSLLVQMNDFHVVPQLDHLFLAFLGFSVFGEKMVIVFVAGCLSPTNRFVLLLFLSPLMKYFDSLGL